MRKTKGTFKIRKMEKTWLKLGKRFRNSSDTERNKETKKKIIKTESKINMY